MSKNYSDTKKWLTENSLLMSGLRRLFLCIQFLLNCLTINWMQCSWFSKGRMFSLVLSNWHLHFFFFIRTLCFCWGSSFLNFSTFEPVFFLFFFLAWAVLRLNFLIFFLNFWCSDSVFSTFLKYFSEICNQGLKINLKL